MMIFVADSKQCKEMHWMHCLKDDLVWLKVKSVMEREKCKNITKARPVIPGLTG